MTLSLISDWGCDGLEGGLGDGVVLEMNIKIVMMTMVVL